MLGLGIVILYLGYAVTVWSIRAFNGTQDSFANYVLPFAPQSSSVSPFSSSSPGSGNTPARTVKPNDIGTNVQKKFNANQQNNAQ